MLNPADLQTAIVEKLRAIPDLVAFVGSEEAIGAYDDESQVNGDLESAGDSLMGFSVLVGWTGAELPRDGQTRGWKHTFRIILQAASIQDYYRLAQMIFDGVPDVPTGDGFNSFLNTTIHRDCDGIQEAQLVTASGKDGSARIVIVFSLTERC